MKVTLMLHDSIQSLDFLCYFWWNSKRIIRNGDAKCQWGGSKLHFSTVLQSTAQTLYCCVSICHNDGVLTVSSITFDGWDLISFTTFMAHLDVGPVLSPRLNWQFGSFVVMSMGLNVSRQCYTYVTCNTHWVSFIQNYASSRLKSDFC